MKNILVLIFFFIASCTGNNDTPNEGSLGNIKMKYKEKLIINLDSKTRNWSMNNQYVYDPTSGKEFVCMLNGPTNSIIFYDLEGKKINTLRFNQEGPESVGIVSGFSYQGTDSLFIVNNQSNCIYHVSSLGKILRTYKFPIFSTNSRRPWAEDGMEMYLHNNHLYIPCVVWVDYRKKPDDFYKEGLIGIDLDLKSGVFKYQNPYPNKEKLMNKPFVSQAINPKCISNPETNELVYSFGADHDVYSFTTDGNLKGKHFFGTRQKEELKPMANRQSLKDIEGEFIHYLNHLCYERLYYDQFRHLYYRVVKHSLHQEFTKKDFHKGSKPKVSYSLIFADVNFKILDEIDLKESIGSGALIITKEGILFQIDEDNEDKMSFELYKLEK